MNYFFLTSNGAIDSEIQVPKYRNDGLKKQGIKLFSAKIEKGKWFIVEVICDSNENFFFVNSNSNDPQAIYFLATEAEVQANTHKSGDTLVNYNDFTDTIPDYRASLSVQNKYGAVSSYQSDYPFNMVERKGSLTSAVHSLSNHNAKSNYIIIRNIYCHPITEKYPGYLVDKQSKEVIKEFSLFTNSSNFIQIENEIINENLYIVAKGYLGIPIYLSEGKNNELSFEHTHPPHENINGDRKFQLVSRARNEILDIVS